MLYANRLVSAMYSNDLIPLELNEGYREVYETECNEYTYFSVYFFHPCYDLTISLAPTAGEPDIYVARASEADQPIRPTKETMTWATYKTKVYTLTIAHWDPEYTPGYYYIGIYNDCSEQKKKAVYQIQAGKDPYNTNDSGLKLPDILAFPDMGMTQSVLLNNYKYYRFCVPQCADVKVFLDSCIDPKLCPNSFAKTELLLSRIIQEPTLTSYR